jgi:hypothetical protein
MFKIIKLLIYNSVIVLIRMKSYTLLKKIDGGHEDKKSSPVPSQSYYIAHRKIHHS